MAKKMLIDATHAEETRVVVVDGNKVEEFDFESENKRQLAGNIYLAKVTRVEPSLQAAFVDYGGNRHGFLAFSEIHPDYYQIPVADREVLMAEEQAYADSLKAREDEDEDEKPKSRSRGRSRSRSKAEAVSSKDAVETQDVDGEISGMETIDLGDDDLEGSSPMETVAETPVDTPSAEEETTDETGDDAADVEQADAGQADGGDDDDDSPAKGASAAAKDDSIESVADEDDIEDIRPPRKPRPRRYKIQEVIKVRQILLVQVVKEERGNKGAALTTYLSLAGRYCVLMPNTARGGGISRKITNAADRKKLKEIAQEIEVPKGAGLIVRTAGAKRTKPEIKRDYEYLQRLWEQIRELTLKSIAPAKIYEEGDLIKRSIRDLYNRDIDEILVEGERGYRIAKDFMKMIMPSHAVNVKQYRESLPLFARFQVETYLAGMFNPTVQLKSGGYIVIGVTEALVAIDVNSGRATKEGSIEETATKTNLEAADEVARQLRLRDLAGLIVIDFIDMDERKNNAAVEKRMKDRLKTDRARIQVGRISGFGLMEMSRQRLRPGMIEATTQPCAACHGTGLIRSDDNLALSILRQIEEEGTRRRSREVLVKAPVGIANFLMNQKREHIAQIEARYGLSVRVEGDPHLVSPDFALEKFKTATRVVPAASAHVVSVDTSIMDQIDEDEAQSEAAAKAQDDVQTQDGNGEGDGKPKRKRRRRSRRRGGSKNNGEGYTNGASADGDSDVTEEGDATPAQAETVTAKDASADADAPAPEEDDKAEDAPAPKKKTTRTRSTTSKAKGKSAAAKKAEAEAEAAPAAAEQADATEVKAEDAEAAPAKPKRTRKPAAPRAKKPKADAEPDASVNDAAKAQPVDAAPAPESKAAQAPTPAPAAKPAPEPVPEPVGPVASSEPAKPKRKGWWSLGK
ncbi:ribonuclease E/G [Sulfitobacter sp. JL08]|uniref:Rne/Rng family ribonuclease n=1 Tax=Sulfitobacter sp. JL08 TaxID=2070369 RepID=UPI000E09FCF0|nr:ribonuclease E/G [Sulfitobacter sp. JL08]AXI54946.1 ribonuclease E/G [Sulfitobacter sp. JL08]